MSIINLCLFRELCKDPKYLAVPRGETMIKGKGMMMTYFLYSNGDVTIDKPDPPAEAVNDTSAKNGNINTSEKQNGASSPGKNTATVSATAIRSDGVVVTDLQECTSKTCEVM